MALLRKHSRLASTALLFAIFALLLSFLPGPNARAEQSGPALNISSIECTDEGAVVHFALARNVSTEAQIGAATLSFTYTMGDGPPQTATAIFDRIAGKTAHFTATLKTTGTLAVTGGRLTVGADTIQLRNTMTQPCGVGTLRICPAPAAETTAPGEMTFSFNVAGVGNFTVAAGNCVDVPNVLVGNVTVTENVPPGYQVTAIRFTAGKGRTDAARGTATATIVAGQTTAIEFTDALPTGTLMICGSLTPGTTVPGGSLFSFSVDGRTVTMPAGNCVTLPNLPAGFVSISEKPCPAMQVVAINYLQGTGTSNVSAASSTADISDGRTTRVEFVNGLPTAFIQICVETAGDLTGTFNFTSPAFAGTQSISLAAGAAQPVCAPAMQVASGTVAITGTAGNGVALAGARLVGPGTLIGVSDSTVTVQVPPGDIGQATQIILRRSPPPPQSPANVSSPGRPRSRRS